MAVCPHPVSRRLPRVFISVDDGVGVELGIGEWRSCHASLAPVGGSHLYRTVKSGGRVMQVGESGTSCVMRKMEGMHKRKEQETRDIREEEKRRRDERERKPPVAATAGP